MVEGGGDGDGGGDGGGGGGGRGGGAVVVVVMVVFCFRLLWFGCYCCCSFTFVVIDFGFVLHSIHFASCNGLRRYHSPLSDPSTANYHAPSLALIRITDSCVPVNERFKVRHSVTQPLLSPVSTPTHYDAVHIQTRRRHGTPGNR